MRRWLRQQPYLVMALRRVVGGISRRVWIGCKGRRYGCHPGQHLKHHVLFCVGGPDLLLKGLYFPRLCRCRSGMLRCLGGKMSSVSVEWRPNIGEWKFRIYWVILGKTVPISVELEIF